MRSVQIIVCGALTSLLALGACSGKHDASGNSAAANSSAPAVTADATPMPKPGLWEMTATSAGVPKPIKMQACIGKPAPGTNPFAPPTAPGQTCSKNAIKRTATGYTIDMECAANGMTVAVSGEVSGDFSSSYRTDLTTKMTGANLPPAAAQPIKSSVESKYVGACPAGMKPGEAKQVS